jgi:DNA primase
MIPRDFIDTLLARVDIVDVIDRRVPLKKAGQNYQACCPFHSEKTPSFTVSPTKQFYHCFGCGAHGTALGFLMEYEHMGFPDAVAALAQDVGLPVPESGEPDRPRPPPALWDALEQAAQFYRQQLKQTPRAIDYLKQRGLTGAIAARYGIGYAPDGSPLKQVFTDYTADALAASGLVIDGDRGRYDRFRDRIMFPIKNVKGQIVGFGGRVLDQGEPKYLNSPETPLFHKGSELYGLFEARAAIKAAGRVIVVEGYMDVVALAQHGVEFAVAALGTATTPIHARTLLRHSDRLIFAFDGDNAGPQGRLARAGKLAGSAAGRQGSQLPVPARRRRPRQLHPPPRPGRLSCNCWTPIRCRSRRFWCANCARGRKLDSQEGRAALIKEAKPLLGKIAAPLLASLIQRQIAELAHLQADELGLMGAKPSVARRTPQRPQRRPAPSRVRSLARTLLMNPQRAAEVDPCWLDVNDPLSERMGELLNWLREVEQLSLPALAEAARGSALETLVDELMTDLLDKDDSWDWNAEFDGAVKQLRDDWQRRRWQQLAARPLSSLSASERQELTELARS